MTSARGIKREGLCEWGGLEGSLSVMCRVGGRCHEVLCVGWVGRFIKGCVSGVGWKDHQASCVEWVGGAIKCLGGWTYKLESARSFPVKAIRINISEPLVHVVLNKSSSDCYRQLWL